MAKQARGSLPQYFGELPLIFIPMEQGTDLRNLSQRVVVLVAGA